MRPIISAAIRYSARGLRPPSRRFTTAGRLLQTASVQPAPSQGHSIGTNATIKKPKSFNSGSSKNTKSTPTVSVQKNSVTLSRGQSKEPKRFSFLQLRDFCKCPKCVDPHSKQRSFRTQDIPAAIAPRSVVCDGKTLDVTWHNDIEGYGSDHVSRWDLDYLAYPVLNPHRKRGREGRQILWTRDKMQDMQHWISYDDYINNDEKFAGTMRNLIRTGLVFVKDIPQSRDMVEKIATRMGPLRNSFYGPTWDVRTVPEAKNVAYTNQFLGFHMDLLYMNEPPGYQLLHCLENSCEGGESLFVDTFQVAFTMRKTSPHLFDLLTKNYLAYEYRHENAIYHNSRPVIQMKNDKFYRYVNYSPPFQSLLPPVRLEDGSESYSEALAFNTALKQFSDLMEQESRIFQLKLKPGECVLFANRRVAHARSHFNTSSGSRWLAGAYVDEDAVLSSAYVSSRKHPIASDAAEPRVQRYETQRPGEGSELEQQTGL